jgi:hypothetical protein
MTNLGHEKPWTQQTLDMTNPRHGKPKTHEEIFFEAK